MYIGRAESPLHYAATLKDEELAQRMIDLVLGGASSVERTKMVDTMDTEQVTPLDAAVHYNNPATVNIFLQHRAQIRPKTFELLLHDAWVPRADNDSATACRILESLLDAGASLQNCELDLSKTIWIDPSKKMFRMFVTRGNLNVTSLNNALGGAIRLGYIDLVELLLQSGADSNFVTVEGETPLMTAVRFCSDAGLFDDTFRLLCRHGADVNKVTRQGCTALAVAFLWGQFPTAVQLIRCGANVNSIYMPDGSGRPMMNEDFGEEIDDDYTIWLELQYNLFGLNRLLVHYGLDVANLISLNDRSTGLAPDCVGYELRNWMLRAKKLVQRFGPATPPVTPNSPATLMSLCRDRLHEDDCNHNVVLDLLPECLQEYLCILCVNTFVDWED